MPKFASHVVSFFAVCAGLSCTAQADGVADPLVAIRTLYASAALAKSNSAGLAAIYMLAGRPLRSHLLGTGWCTFPMRTRTLTCAEALDVIGNGAPVPHAGVGIAATAADPSQRQISVMFDTRLGPQEMRYNFARGSSGWVLDDVVSVKGRIWALRALNAADAVPPAASPPAVEEPRPSAE